jgi:hypothetical protein
MRTWSVVTPRKCITCILAGCQLPTQARLTALLGTQVHQLHVSPSPTSGSGVGPQALLQDHQNCAALVTLKHAYDPRRRLQHRFHSLHEAWPLPCVGLSRQMLKQCGQWCLGCAQHAAALSRMLH